MKRSRRKFTAEFKAKVVLEAIKEQKSLSELAEQFELHPNLISIWKREFLDNAAKVFSKGDEIKNTIEEVEKEKEELFILVSKRTEYKIRRYKTLNLYSNGKEETQISQLQDKCRNGAVTRRIN